MSPNWLWVFGSVLDVDFSWTNLIQESFTVTQSSMGGITLRDLKDMDYDDYIDTVVFADKLSQRKEIDNG